MNSVNIIGNIGNDLEVRYTGSGKAVLNLSLAYNDYNNDVKWFRVVIWDKVAENTAKFCSKGSKIGVSGRLDINEYTNNDGQVIQNVEVVAITVDFLDTKPKQSDSNQGNNAAATSANSTAPANTGASTASNQSFTNSFEGVAAQDNPFASNANDDVTDISKDDLPF